MTTRQFWARGACPRVAVSSRSWRCRVLLRCSISPRSREHLMLDAGELNVTGFCEGLQMCSLGLGVEQQHGSGRSLSCSVEEAFSCAMSGDRGSGHVAHCWTCFVSPVVRRCSLNVFAIAKLAAAAFRFFLPHLWISAHVSWRRRRVSGEPAGGRRQGCTFAGAFSVEGSVCMVLRSRGESRRGWPKTSQSAVFIIQQVPGVGN